VVDLNTYIGQRIRELRLAYPGGALSQEVLANRLKMAPNTISRWETGTYKLKPEDLDELARFFGVSIMVFFPQSDEESDRVATLTSATGGLSENDFEEVIRYAEFRKARSAMKNNKMTRKKSKDT
jgi:transcriptional regulator with XRE-family HTH domain